jgi:hypothetical protein
MQFESKHHVAHSIAHIPIGTHPGTQMNEAMGVAFLMKAWKIVAQKR